MTKTLNFKIKEKLLNEVNYYRKLDPNGPLNQVNYVINALNEKNIRTENLINGGQLINVEKPDLSLISDIQKKEIINILAECLSKLLRINPYATLGVDEILIYAKNMLR